MELKARSIKLFCAVVETGSLLSAANQNAMSAPAASRAVSQLEDRLGCRLFDRSTKMASVRAGTTSTSISGLTTSVAIEEVFSIMTVSVLLISIMTKAERNKITIANFLAKSLI